MGLRVELPVSSASKSAPIGIVGAGPARLSAAYHMTRMGYAVTIFEAAPSPGGMMRYRIPRSAIPAEILEAEIENVLSFGIELRTGCVVGRDVPFEKLQRNYRAVYFAMGLQKAAQLEPRAGGADQAVLFGTLAAEPPDIPAGEATEVEPRVLNSVSVAIAQGRAVAEAIAAHIEGRTNPRAPLPTAIRSEKLKVDWYPAAQRFDNGAAAMTEAEVLAEAAHCMSCGMCMDGETCWMYCSKNCFVKLPKGEHYKIKLDLCNGCGKCVESCPCGYFEMN